MSKKKKRSQRFYDYSLLFTIVFLTIFGLVMIYSASSYTAQIHYDGNAAYYMTKQGAIALGGFAIMIMVSKMDYHWYARFSNLAIVVSWGLMIAVSLFGRKINGKRRWLGVGTLSFQPTELVKITVIVAMAALITRIGKDVDRTAGITRAALITLPLAAIVAHNNLSSGIIIAGIGFVTDKTGVFKQKDAKRLIDLLFNVILPIAIVHTFMTMEYSAEHVKGIFIAFICAFATHIFGMLISLYRDRGYFLLLCLCCGIQYVCLYCWYL